MKKITTVLFILVLSTIGVKSQNTYSEFQKVVASDREQSDNYGSSIEADGDWAVVGAPYESHDVNNSNYLQYSGSAYILKNVDGTWVEFQKIVASDRAALDNFGYSVGIAGEYIVVGAPKEDEDASGANELGQAGSAYIFHYNGTSWVQQQKIVASNRIADHEFGTEVAVGMVSASSPSIPTVSVGTVSGNEAVYVFEYSASIWSEVTTLNATNQEMNDYFGSAISISGTYMAIGCNGDKEDASEANPLNGAGSVYIFHRTISDWLLYEKIVSNTRAEQDGFGTSIDLDNINLIVGAPYDNTDENGLNSKINSGAAYIYSFSSGSWVLKNKLVNSDRDDYDVFGTDVSIHGDYASVTAEYEDEDENGNNTVISAGSSYIFYDNENDDWQESQKIVPSHRVGDGFGEMTSVIDDYIFVTSLHYGYNEEDQDLKSNAGAAFVFTSNIFITNQPVSASDKCVNDTCLFVFSAENIDNQFWYVSTDGGNTFDFMLGENSDTLSVTPDTSMNGYMYYSKVSPISGAGYIYSDTVSLYIETQAPSFSTNNISINLDASGNASIIATDIISNVADNCDISDTTISKTNFNCSDIGINSDTVTITDISGNQTQEIVQVTVNDVTDPTITCANNTVVIASQSGEYTVQGADFDPVSTSDNCAVESVVNDLNTTSSIANEVLSIGTNTINWTVTDVNGNSTDCSMDIQVDAYTGVETLQQNGISIYPNPTSGKLTINNGQLTIQNIEITDFTGKIIKSFPNSKIKQFSNLEIDLSNYENGIYIISIQTDIEIFTTKLIKE